MSAIDPVYETLRDIRLDGSIFCRADLEAPWAFSTKGSQHAIFHAVVCGSAWLIPDGGAPMVLDTGDLVVLPAGTAHVLCDHPDRVPVPIAGLAVFQEGARVGLLQTKGDGPRTELLCGTFRIDPLARGLLADLMANVLHVRHRPTGEWLAGTLEMISAELRDGAPGAGLVADRMADVLLIRVLRAHLASRANGGGGWLGGLRDERIGRALAWLHRDPGSTWTVSELARRAGMSRAAFYKRFVELVGQPPALYAAAWRINLAKSHLARGAGLGDVADQVGYSSAAALSKAFKRHVGTSPGAWQQSAA